MGLLLARLLGYLPRSQTHCGRCSEDECLGRLLIKCAGLDQIAQIVVRQLLGHARLLLVVPHITHGLLQRREAAVMEIRSRLRDDAQRRDFELSAGEDVFYIFLVEGRRKMACLAAGPHEYVVAAFGGRGRTGGRRSIGIQIGVRRIAKRSDVSLQRRKGGRRRLRPLHPIDDDGAHVCLQARRGARP